MTAPIFRLVVAGGGTGGHLFPGIAIAQALKRVDPRHEVLFVGTEKGIEVTEVPKAGFDLELIEVAGLKRVGLKQTLKSLFMLPASYFQSRSILRRFNADAVIGVGGYASGPLVLAAKTMGIPTAICEQNSVPGLTNRILGKLVRRVFGAFSSAAPFFAEQKFSVVGNPVRERFLQAAATTEEQKSIPKKRVFVFGGSQGARPLNQNIPQGLALLKSEGQKFSILHQAGNIDIDDVKLAYEELGVQAEVTPFISDMVTAYRAASIVVCRAGATSCSELTALGVPSILIPFPQAADDHQTTNAMDLVDVGAAVLLAQSELTPEKIAAELRVLLEDQDLRNAMAAAAKSLGKLEASDVVIKDAMRSFRTPKKDVISTSSPKKGTS
ncbi:MAG: undecaprenyldiphospho-muramoylpentapeptide beta-N-acetylglucosaminyltransferase [Deltaproteobacteria bacterium]|nr:undecaprenyldiphospho-muramoylpentapeptide beta-N-acetylglucosaminyltransferase [Deltaproteobacteria bacterium]